MTDLSALERELERLQHDEDAPKAIEHAILGLVLGRSAKAAFFAMLAMKIKMQPDRKVETACIDGKTMRYNPSFVCGLNREQVQGLLAHELMHCVLHHNTRRRHRDPKKWNIAADLAVNSTLRGLVELPPGGLVPGEPGPYFHFPRDESAEVYYAMLNEQGDENQSGDASAAGGGAGNPGDPGDPGEDQSDSPPDPGRCGGVEDAGDPAEMEHSEAEWDMNATQAGEAVKSKGDLPDQIARLVQNILEPKADWKELLRRFLSRAARNDYSWFPPNRRHIANGVYLPSCRSEDLGTVVIAVDTSGSISAEDLALFAAEVESILASYDCTVRILYHDSKVAGEQEWSSTDGPLQLEPVGGGGTSHVDVLEKAEEFDVPTCIVCLTDGYTEFPENPPTAPVLWAMTTTIEAPFGETIAILP